MAFGFISALAASVVVILLYRLSRTGRRPEGYPPGPPTLPLIGNLHLMPKQKGHLQFERWANEYGPIYSLILGTQVMVVISSDKVVKDLLDKRSGIYSSRPDMYLSQDIASGGLRMGIMEYGETWRMSRGIFHKGLNIATSRAYIPYQELESRAMLLGFLGQPSEFFNHIRRYTNSTMTQTIFGFRTVDIHDPNLQQLVDGIGKWSQLAGSQSAALLDVFPILRRLPDAVLPSRRYAKKLHEKELAMYLGHYLSAKKRLLEGKAKPCIASEIVRAQDELGFSDSRAGYLNGTILEAGSDTSASTLIGFVQAMLIFPEVSKLAQAEIDEVCGDRIPSLDDLPDLPYVRGCVKESMRWMPTTMLGLPHATIRDDEYLGYKIPKGAAVVLNVWAIHNDASRYPEPRRFDPSRWAHDSQTSAESANNQDPSKRDQFAFGAGRRICQGIHIADRALFLGISRLLWAFDFQRPVDPSTGEEIVPDMEDLDEGLLACPNPFGADIKPRSASRAEAIRAEWDKMAELLDGDLQWKEVPEGVVGGVYVPDETKADL
ncbi:cytochrome P450 [Xylaria grammica]|nr:cytochrome P450 [Xylaria grammica]